MLGKCPYDDLDYTEYNVVKHLPDGTVITDVALHKIQCYLNITGAICCITLTFKIGA